MQFRNAYNNKNFIRYGNKFVLSLCIKVDLIRVELLEKDVET